jgi:hypothetical protein
MERFSVWLAETVVDHARAKKSLDIMLQSISRFLCWRWIERWIPIYLVKVRDGTEGYHIGVLPWHIVHGIRKEGVANKCGQLLELYKESNAMTKKGRICGGVVLLLFAFWVASIT